MQQYFNALEFYKIVEDATIIDNSTHEVNENLVNKWSFKVSLETVVNMIF